MEVPELESVPLFDDHDFEDDRESEKTNYFRSEGWNLKPKTNLKPELKEKKNISIRRSPKRVTPTDSSLLFEQKQKPEPENKVI